MFDVSEVVALGTDLGRIGGKTSAAMFDVYKDTAGDLRNAWRRNATETAGKHGRHYPKAITFDMKVSTSITAEIGPDPSLPQGGMSFEFGSAKQEPHLDGQRATDEVVPRLDRRIDATLGQLLGGL